MKNTQQFSDFNQLKQLQDRRHLQFGSSKRSQDCQKTKPCRIIGRQFLRSGTSVAANYRGACRARSTADFVSTISVVCEEADETLFGVELLVEAELVKSTVIESLMKEPEELLKICSASSQPRSAIVDH